MSFRKHFRFNYQFFRTVLPSYLSDVASQQTRIKIMPLVRLSFLTEKSAAWRAAVSDGVQQAMVETIGVPPADRFHILSEHAPDFLVIDPTYLGVARSGDPLVIEIALRAGRTDAQKRALYRRITERLAENPGIRPADVMITLVENQLIDWSFGDGIAHYVPG